MKPRISMIMLGVDDIEKSVASYRDWLGFPRSKVHQRLPSLFLT
jgi:catechol 2,3-dioxygenase-like lactoylglutathione lyase family enzyme